MDPDNNQPPSVMHNPGGRSERSQRTTIMHIYAAERQRRQAGGAAPAGKQSGQLQPLHRVIRGPHPGRVPDICAAPVTSSTGQAALVADVYREWFAGASPAVAPQDAACCSGTPMAQVTHRSRPSSRPCPTAGQSGAGHRLHGNRRPALVIPLWHQEPGGKLLRPGVSALLAVLGWLPHRHWVSGPFQSVGVATMRTRYLRPAPNCAVAAQRWVPSGVTALPLAVVCEGPCSPGMPRR